MRPHETESWKAAFQQSISAELLERLTDYSRSERMYRRLLQEGKGNGYLLSVHGKPHGIAWWDATREDIPGYAQIICIHSLPENWRRGYGSKLMDYLICEIARAGYFNAMLWMFVANGRARKFYEAKGFRATDKTQPAFGSREICYVRAL